jgi:hypothetical protein
VKNMKMIKDICKQTETPTGKIVVGASVLILGLSHFGMGMGLETMLGGWVGTIVGTVGVVVGSCVLLNLLMNRGA